MQRLGKSQLGKGKARALNHVKTVHTELMLRLCSLIPRRQGFVFLCGVEPPKKALLTIFVYSTSSFFLLVIKYLKREKGETDGGWIHVSVMGGDQWWVETPSRPYRPVTILTGVPSVSSRMRRT